MTEEPVDTQRPREWPCCVKAAAPLVVGERVAQKRRGVDQ